MILTHNVQIKHRKDLKKLFLIFFGCLKVLDLENNLNVGAKNNRRLVPK